MDVLITVGSSIVSNFEGEPLPHQKVLGLDRVMYDKVVVEVPQTMGSLLQHIKFSE